MDELIEGRIVHYVLDTGRFIGEHRPAVIVKVWPKYGDVQLVNMLVFTDCTNDFLVGDGTKGIMWATSIHCSEGKEPRTWHWIEKA